MEIEKVHERIRYTLSNDNLQNGDLVYHIANGRCLDGGGWILHGFDFRSGFPDEPHKILTLEYSTYKPYQVQTSHGFGPIEAYYKVIKREEQIVESENRFGKTYKWVAI